MSNGIIRLLNISLQSATMVIRFAFVFLLAKYIDTASFGYYGLFVAAIGYSFYFVGLDFYTYSIREILRVSNNNRGILLKGQASLSAILYLFFIPASFFLIINYSGWPDYLLYWFFPILLLEHFNQEVCRLLSALSEQLTASFLSFVRQGSWSLVVVVLLINDNSSRNLEVVLALWAIAGLISAIIAIVKIKRLKIGGWSDPINWIWVKNGIVVSMAFLLATLALRGVHTADRYMIEALGGAEIVGAYILFFGIANALLGFLDAGLFAFTYPVLIKLYQANEYNAVKLKLREMVVFTMLMSVGFAVVTIYILPDLLLWINNPIYISYKYLYPWLLSAVIINALSLIPHFALYARNFDKPIIYSHIIAFVVFLSASYFLIPHFRYLAIPISLNISFVVILFVKTISFWRLSQDA